jgi:hypothetical protein
VNTEITSTCTLEIKQLTGATLNWAVAKSLGKLKDYEQDHMQGNGRYHLYSSNLELGGEIIEKHKISTAFIHEGLWLANNAFAGRTHIEAAMRFYVWDHLGDEVNVPIEQHNYEIEIARLSETLDQLNDQELYAMRVEQLENEGMTTSDAQGCADYEESQNLLFQNVRDNLGQQPFEYPIKLVVIK